MPSQSNMVLGSPDAGGMSKPPALPSSSWLPLKAFSVGVSEQSEALAG